MPLEDLWNLPIKSTVLWVPLLMPADPTSKADIACLQPTPQSDKRSERGTAWHKKLEDLFKKASDLIWIHKSDTVTTHHLSLISSMLFDPQSHRNCHFCQDRYLFVCRWWSLTTHLVGAHKETTLMRGREHWLQGSQSSFKSELHDWKQCMLLPHAVFDRGSCQRKQGKPFH